MSSPSRRRFPVHTFFWRIALVFGLVLSSVVAASEWEIESGLDADPRLEKLRDVLRAARTEALELLRQRFGLVPGRLPVTWKLVSKLPVEGGSRQVKEHEAGRTVVREQGVETILPAHRYLARPRKARRVVIHEAAHGLLASRLGLSRYESLPSWFREGFALLASGEGETRVEAQIALTVLEGGAPHSFLRGLHQRRAAASATAPAESYLAVRALNDRLGEGGMRKVVVLLSRGEAFRPPIASSTLDRAAVDRVSELAPSSVVVRFRWALERLQAGDSAAAERLFSALSAEESTGAALRSSARYFLARARLRGGNVEAASRELQRIVSSPEEGVWEPEALNSIAECSLDLGKVSEARSCLLETLERFPEDRSATLWAKRLLRRTE